MVVGGANFTEMSIMEQMYAQLLTKAGCQVSITAVDNREIYYPALVKGQISVVPEYAATLADFVNLQVNGPKAPSIATNDPLTTVEAMQPLLAKQGLQALTPSQAADQNGFAVKTSFAQKNNISTLSGLAGLKKPIVLAAVTECPQRPFCAPGLEKTYGLNITKILPLGFGTSQAKQAVLDGKADLVLTGTTDGTLKALGLTLLKDDKNLQLADNLVPVINTSTLPTSVAEKALDPLSKVLTTEDLTAMNLQVDGQRKQAQDVAKAYLTSKGLL